MLDRHPAAGRMLRLFYCFVVDGCQVIMGFVCVVMAVHVPPLCDVASGLCA